MPSSSLKQKKLMSAAAHNPEFARKVGVDPEVAKEWHEKDKQKDSQESLPASAHWIPPDI